MYYKFRKNSLIMDIRLNKYISDSGYCSRREADKYIEKGKVNINGKIASVGDRVTSKDKVKVNGNLIDPREEYVYLALNKPAGITCTTDTTDSTNIVDFVNYPTRIFNIGRLDKDSEGLILLTDNGDIVNKILRAGNNHEKEYEVAVDKSITDGFIEKMSSGVPILDVVTRKCKIIKEGDKNFRITLTQGLNRQIRRMCEHFGYSVVKLRRVRVMNIKLDNLALEQWRNLTDKEVDILMASIKGSNSAKKASSGSSKKSSSSKSNNDSEKKDSSSGSKSTSSSSSGGGAKTGKSFFKGSKSFSKSSKSDSNKTKFKSKSKTGTRGGARTKPSGSFKSASKSSSRRGGGR